MTDKDKFIFDIINAVEDDLRVRRGYHIYGTFLHGSQNYGLDLYTKDYQSDVDLKCFVIPNFDDLFYNRLVSTTEDNGFGGHVEIKDIRLLPSLLAKGNVAYLECLCTHWKKCSDQRITDMCDRIVEERFPLVVKAIYGMALSKVSDMRHPFPTKEGIIAKYGYDPKQLSHLVRMLYLLEDMIDGHKTLAWALFPDDEKRDVLLRLKLGSLPNDQVDAYAAGILAQIKEYVDRYASPAACRSLNNDVENDIRRIVAAVVRDDLGCLH